MSDVIDKNAVRQRFRRSLETYSRSATIQRDMAETLLDLHTSATLERQFETILPHIIRVRNIRNLMGGEVTRHPFYFTGVFHRWGKMHQRLIVLIIHGYDHIEIEEIKG